MLRQRYVGGMPNILMAPKLPTTPLETPGVMKGGMGSGTKKDTDKVDKTGYLYADDVEQSKYEYALKGIKNKAQSVLMKALSNNRGNMDDLYNTPEFTEFQSLQKQYTTLDIERKAVMESKKIAAEEWKSSYGKYKEANNLDDYYSVNGARPIYDKTMNMVGQEINGNFYDANGKLLNPITDKELINEINPNSNKSNVAYLKKSGRFYIENSKNLHDKGQPMDFGILRAPQQLETEINNLFDDSQKASIGGGGGSSPSQLGFSGEVYNVLQNYKNGKTNYSELKHLSDTAFGKLSIEAQDELRQKYWKEYDGKAKVPILDANGKPTGEKRNITFDDYKDSYFESFIQDRLSQEYGYSSYTNMGKSDEGSGGKNKEQDWTQAFISGQLDYGQISIGDDLSKRSEYAGSNTKGIQLTKTDVLDYVKEHPEINWKSNENNKRLSKILNAVYQGYKLSPDGKYLMSKNYISRGFDRDPNKVNDNVLDKLVKSGDVISVPKFSVNTQKRLSFTGEEQISFTMPEDTQELYSGYDLKEKFKNQKLTTLGGYTVNASDLNTAIFFPNQGVYKQGEGPIGKDGKPQPNQQFEGWVLVPFDDLEKFKGYIKEGDLYRKEVPLSTSNWFYSGTSKAADEAKVAYEMSTTGSENKGKQTQEDWMLNTAEMLHKKTSQSIYAVYISTSSYPFYNLKLSDKKSKQAIMPFNRLDNLDKDNDLEPVDEEQPIITK